MYAASLTVPYFNSQLSLSSCQVCDARHDARKLPVRRWMVHLRRHYPSGYHGAAQLEQETPVPAHTNARLRCQV